MIVGSSVNDELNVVGPMKGGIQHFDLLPVLVMVRNSSVEHTEALRGG